jgi:hypothetical protein
MQLHIDSSTQAMHRHGASRALQSIKAAAARNSSPRQSVVAAASAFSSPASSSSFSPIQNGLHWSCASRAPGLLPCNMQQQLQGALALGSCLNSSSVSSSLLRSSVITSAAKRPSAPKRRISSNSGAGSSSSSSSGVSTATAAHLVQTQPSYSSSSSSTGEPAVQLSQRRYNTRSSKSSSNTGSSSGSSSSSTARSTTSALDQQHHAAVHQYLEQLNQEQQLAAYSQEQHVKVIAGGCAQRAVALVVILCICSGSLLALHQQHEDRWSPRYGRSMVHVCRCFVMCLLLLLAISCGQPSSQQLLLLVTPSSPILLATTWTDADSATLPPCIVASITPLLPPGPGSGKTRAVAAVSDLLWTSFYSLALCVVVSAADETTRPRQRQDARCCCACGAPHSIRGFARIAAGDHLHSQGSWGAAAAAEGAAGG